MKKCNLLVPEKHWDDMELLFKRLQIIPIHTGKYGDKIGYEIHIDAEQEKKLKSCVDIIPFELREIA